MVVMKEVLHFTDGVIIAFSLLTFLSFLGVDAVFIWVLLRSRQGVKEADGKAQEREPTGRETGEVTRRSLPEAGASVTEHTTRTLESAEMQKRAELRTGAQDAPRL
jgi:hypothetical protein